MVPTGGVRFARREDALAHKMLEANRSAAGPPQPETASVDASTSLSRNAIAAEQSGVFVIGAGGRIGPSSKRIAYLR